MSNGTRDPGWQSSPAASLIILIGGSWGVVEATLGYALHLLRRVVAVPGLTGYLMFPIGVFFMLAAVRRTGKPVAALLVALVAAAVKLSSGFLPSVNWIFVTNPALASATEGLLVFVAALLFRFRRSAFTVVPALIISVGWRLVFLGLVLALPVQKGILMKGTPALLSFLLVESGVNGLLIAAAIWLGLDTQRMGMLAQKIARPAMAVLVVAVAVGAQLVVSLLA